MNPERDHQEIEDLLAAYALGAADPDEEASVRAHIQGCATCTASLRRLQRAVNAVPLSVEVVEPPARLRDNILAAAAASRSVARTARVPPPVKRARQPGPAWWSRASSWRASIAAAAIIAFALGAGLGLGVGRSLTPAPPPSSSVSQYELAGSGSMSGAQGHVYELKQQGLTLLEFSNLPQLEAGKVYELWLIPPQGQPVPGGVFKPDAVGNHVFVLARNLEGVAVLAVTSEQGPNGTSAPTQQPELAGKVT